jgi:alpha-amylase/alpha-mannosidase (GH57 family)
VAASIVIHGHFYQPPRENPWTGVIDPQPSAGPFADWNERVHAECYHPNAFAKVPGPDGEKVVNNFECISFDAGPTLLAWMESAHPETYERIIEADRASRTALGNGNAMAQAYHHTILPLSPARDVRTQILWGLADFGHRFGRRAEGMWLPECAANEDVLVQLIECGVEFTVLAPWQATLWAGAEGPWVDATRSPPDTTIPYRFDHPDGSGRWLTVFFYDAGIAQAIAFEEATASAENYLWLFARRAWGGAEIIHAATDGETYGHHHKFADLGLAYALFEVAPRHDMQVTNYAAFLAGHEPSAKVRITQGEGTSWSCAHGVGRWTRDCGCSTGGEPDWNQSWRTPLRDALNMVHGQSCELFVRAGMPLFRDPWGARDRYIEVLLGATDVGEFIEREAAGRPSADDVRWGAQLLELQRWSMSMFTSCGWFFNDLANIETLQILRYAARTIEELEKMGQGGVRGAFEALLHAARSNDPAAGHGAEIFRDVSHHGVTVTQD